MNVRVFVISLSAALLVAAPGFGLDLSSMEPAVPNPFYPGGLVVTSSSDHDPEVQFLKDVRRRLLGNSDESTTRFIKPYFKNLARTYRKVGLGRLGRSVRQSFQILRQLNRNPGVVNEARGLRAARRIMRLASAPSDVWIHGLFRVYSDSHRNVPFYQGIAFQYARQLGLAVRNSDHPNRPIGRGFGKEPKDLWVRLQNPNRHLSSPISFVPGLGYSTYVGGSSWNLAMTASFNGGPISDDGLVFTGGVSGVLYSNSVIAVDDGAYPEVQPTIVVEATAVPEPGSIAFGTALLAAVVIARRRRKAAN